MADRIAFATRVGELLRPVRYDSGVRNVAQAFLGGYTSATFAVSLSRTGPVVEFVCYVRQFDKAPAPTGTVLFTLPAGFRPRQTYRVPAASPSTVFIDVEAGGAVKIASGSITQGAYVTFRFMHPTVQAPPTVLPGP